MVHILNSHLRSEFLACPQLVRFDMAHGADGPEPTLLIKANSLGLKYLLRRKEFRFVVTLIGSKIAYAVEIPDDPEAPATAWSLLELPAEKEALLTLMREPRCVVYLFNELAVSVAWSEVQLLIELALSVPIGNAEFHSGAAPEDAEIVGGRLERIRAGNSVPNTQILGVEGLVWNELRASYITNQIGSSNLYQAALIRTHAPSRAVRWT